MCGWGGVGGGEGWLRGHGGMSAGRWRGSDGSVVAVAGRVQGKGEGQTAGSGGTDAGGRRDGQTGGAAREIELPP